MNISSNVSKIELRKRMKRGYRNKSKAVYFGIILFLFIIIGVVPVQSAILRAINPTSKSYISVVPLVIGSNNPQPSEAS